MVNYEYAHSTGYYINEKGVRVMMLTQTNIEETIREMNNQNAAPGVVKKPKTKKEQQDIISLKKFNEVIPDEKAAIAYAEKMIWGETPFCGRCGADNVYRVESGKPMSHKCRDCNQYYSVRTGTVMADTNLPIRTWLLAIYFMHTARKGMSALQLQKMLGTNYETTWFLCHRIREAMKPDKTAFEATVVEIDEAYLGSKKRWMHSYKKETIERWQDHKAVIFGIKDRETGRVMAFPICYGMDADTDMLLDEVLTHVDPTSGTTVYTDGHPAYANLNDWGYDHDWVNHGVGEYVRGQVTTNGIESFWTLVKRGQHGVYHFMSWKHLHRYINEFAYRQSAGPGNGFKTIGEVLRRMRGRRLTYKRLTKGRD